MLSLSLTRLAPAVHRARALSALSPTSTWSLSALRTFSDDAGEGPSRTSYKKMQRQRMRESVATGRTTEIKDLSFLDAPAPQRSKPSQGRSSSSSSSGPRRGEFGEVQVERGEWHDGPRFRNRRDRDRYYAEKRAQEKAGKHNSFIKQQSTYDSSRKVRAWIERHQSPLSDKQIEEIVKMVEELPPRSVNAAVWNPVLALIGKEGKYARMWKAFNQMKKRGVQPTSRTYTTLLNVYAGISHSNIASGQFTPHTRPEKLTLDRVRLIYEQSQRHIAEVMAKAQPEELDEDDGLAAPAWPSARRDDAEPEKPKVDMSEINVLPTNSYLKFLGRFGMWDEMKRVFVAMDHEGPLSPNTITYTTMLMAANNIATYRKANPEATDIPEINIGPTARSYWDQAVRQMCSRDPTAAYDATRQLDEGLALIALQCFAIGRPADQRLVDKLIPRLWDLPSRSEPSVASASASARPAEPGHSDSDLPLAYASLPKFTLTLRSATSLMSLLSRASNRAMASYYAHLILDKQHLQADWDLLALRAGLYTFANARDIEGVRNVLDSYQPPTGKDGWPVDIYHAALRAARWGADWDAALTFFRRMTHLPLGVELGKPPKPYVFKTPNGRKTDIRGKNWVEGRAHRVDALAMSTLIKAGVACGLKEARQAINVFDHYGAEQWWLVPQNTITKKGVVTSSQVVDLLSAPDPSASLSSSTRKAILDRVELAKDVVDAVERLVVVPKDDDDKKRLYRLKDAAAVVIKHYGTLSKTKQRQ